MQAGSGFHWRRGRRRSLTESLNSWGSRKLQFAEAALVLITMNLDEWRAGMVLRSRDILVPPQLREASLRCWQDRNVLAPLELNTVQAGQECPGSGLNLMGKSGIACAVSARTERALPFTNQRRPGPAPPWRGGLAGS